MSPAQPVCLITGASSGIGAALAREFSRRQSQTLVITARREERLESLADEISSAGRPRPHVIVADLAAPEGVKQLAETLGERGFEPAILVNNAGFGTFGQAAQVDANRELDVIEVNTRALTELTLRFIDSIKRQRGGILNVASIAGFLPGPGMAVYHATKAYVVSFTEALHEELKGDRVRVCALCPGPVETEFNEKAGVPHDYFPQFLTVSAERVAREGYEGFMSGHRVVVPGLPNRLITLLPRLLPHGVILAAEQMRWKLASRRAR
jgi:short-subunit dehydrogenase